MKRNRCGSETGSTSEDGRAVPDSMVRQEQVILCKGGLLRQDFDGVLERTMELGGDCCWFLRMLPHSSSEIVHSFGDKSEGKTWVPNGRWAVLAYATPLACLVLAQSTGPVPGRRCDRNRS
jgi:hypothetical protein